MRDPVKAVFGDESAPTSVQAAGPSTLQVRVFWVFLSCWLVFSLLIALWQTVYASRFLPDSPTVAMNTFFVAFVPLCALLGLLAWWKRDLIPILLQIMVALDAFMVVLQVTMNGIAPVLVNSPALPFFMMVAFGRIWGALLGVVWSAVVVGLLVALDHWATVLEASVRAVAILILFIPTYFSLLRHRDVDRAARSRALRTALFAAAAATLFIPLAEGNHYVNGISNAVLFTLLGLWLRSKERITSYQRIALTVVLTAGYLTNLLFFSSATLYFLPSFLLLIFLLAPRRTAAILTACTLLITTAGENVLDPYVFRSLLGLFILALTFAVVTQKLEARVALFATSWRDTEFARIGLAALGAVLLIMTSVMPVVVFGRVDVTSVEWIRYVTRVVFGALCLVWLFYEFLLYRTKLQRGLENELARESRFLGVVGHELRTPLAVLTAGLEARDVAEQERVTLSEMESAADRLAGVVSDLSAMSQSVADVAIVKADFLLRECLQSFREHWTGLATRFGIALHIDDVFSGVYSYCGDVNRIQSLLAILVRYSCMHSGAKNIWVSAGIESLDSAVDRVTFVVQDDGADISNAVIDQLAQVLGAGDMANLAESFGIDRLLMWLDLLGGEVRCARSEHGGLRVEMSLTLERSTAAEDQSAPITATARTTLEGWIKRMRILVVDDDRFMREALSNLLRRVAGGEVLVAADAEEALRMLEHTDVGLIFTDFFMPKMSGADFAQQLRQQGSEVAIVVLTSASTEEELLALSRSGVDRVINKHMSEQTLLELLDQLRRAGRLPAPRI